MSPPRFFHFFMTSTRPFSTCTVRATALHGMSEFFRVRLVGGNRDRSHNRDHEEESTDLKKNSMHHHTWTGTCSSSTLHQLLRLRQIHKIWSGRHKPNIIQCQHWCKTLSINFEATNTLNNFFKVFCSCSIWLDGHWKTQQRSISKTYFYVFSMPFLLVLYLNLIHFQ